MVNTCARTLAPPRLRLAAVLIGAAACVFVPSRALAACTWTWDCSEGPCRQIPICDSTLDLPPLRPPSIAPIPAPTLRPLPRPVLPPLGNLCISRSTW
jgi:hypothetical protein